MCFCCTCARDSITQDKTVIYILGSEIDMKECDSVPGQSWNFEFYEKEDMKPIAP